MLRQQFKGDLLRPGHGGYEDSRTIWNGMFARRPGLIARCADAGDVQSAIRAASTAGILTAVRCGGHSLAGFSIDEKTGKLAALEQTPTEKTPRSFDIEPDGRFLFSAGEGSGKLAVFRVSQSTGGLTRVHTYDVGKSLAWVMAVKVTGK